MFVTIIIEIITLYICEGVVSEREEGYREEWIGEHFKNSKTLKLITVKQILCPSHVNVVHPVISLPFNF